METERETFGSNPAREAKVSLSLLVGRTGNSQGSMAQSAFVREGRLRSSLVLFRAPMKLVFSLYRGLCSDKSTDEAVSSVSSSHLFPY